MTTVTGGFVIPGGRAPMNLLGAVLMAAVGVLVVLLVLRLAGLA